MDKKYSELMKEANEGHMVNFSEEQINFMEHYEKFGKPHDFYSSAGMMHTDPGSEEREWDKKMWAIRDKLDNYEEIKKSTPEADVRQYIHSEINEEEIAACISDTYNAVLNNGLISDYSMDIYRQCAEIEYIVKHSENGSLLDGTITIEDPETGDTVDISLEEAMSRIRNTMEDVSYDLCVQPVDVIKTSAEKIYDTKTLDETLQKANSVIHDVMKAIHFEDMIQKNYTQVAEELSSYAAELRDIASQINPREEDSVIDIHSAVQKTIIQQAREIQSLSDNMAVLYDAFTAMKEDREMTEEQIDVFEDYNGYLGEEKTAPISQFESYVRNNIEANENEIYGYQVHVERDCEFSYSLARAEINAEYAEKIVEDVSRQLATGEISYDDAYNTVSEQMDWIDDTLKRYEWQLNYDQKSSLREASEYLQSACDKIAEKENRDQKDLEAQIGE